MSPKPSSPERKPKEEKQPTGLKSLLVRSWRLVAANRTLWWLGLLAGLAQGYGINPEFLARADRRFDPAYWQERVLSGDPTIVPALFVLLLFGALFWIISLISEAGLTKAVVALEGKGTVTFRQALTEGRPYLWRLAGLSIFIALVTMLVAFLVGLPAVTALTSGTLTGRFTGGFGVVLLTVYGLSVALLFPWMTRSVVLGDRRILAAIGAAWRLFRARPGELFTIGLFGVLWQILAWIVIGLAAVVLLIPFLFLTLLIFRNGTASGAAVGSVALGIGAVVVVLAGILTALKNAYYTLAFERLVLSDKK